MELLFDENDLNVTETHKFISKGGNKKGSKGGNSGN